MTEGHYLITIGQSAAWGLGCCKSPAASGQRPGGGAGGKAPGKSENIVFYSTGERA